MAATAEKEEGHREIAGQGGWTLTIKVTVRFFAMTPPGGLGNTKGEL
jgi:hypothetical protein